MSAKDKRLRVRLMSAKDKRLRVRLACRDADGTLLSILEQDIPATDHEVTLLLRRDPFKRAIAAALLRGGSITLERLERKP